MLKKDGKHMNAESFAYWLQGYFEISGSSTLSDTQVQIIKDHLDLVFNKVTPVRFKPSQESVDKLKKIFESNSGGLKGLKAVDNLGYENMGSTIYTDNHPLAEIIIPHTC